MAFRGKVAFVTGAASGMGRLAVQRLARAGASVAGFDVNEAGLEETARGLANVRVSALDVTDRKAVEAAVERVEAELGPIERVMSAAGVMPTCPLLEEDVDRIHRVMAINYTGSVNVAMATVPRMVRRRRGDFVQFASASGLIPNLHYAAYSASKFAVVAFTEVLWQETRGQGVRVACVCPGPVDTPLLEQANPKTRIVRAGIRIPPERVLDDIERCLERGRFYVFANWQSALGWRIRRFAPGLMWWINHRIEGA
jgi:NAD(P)-dependent dehydrogenase (short-subunit alcohol dehydrogenase family)